MSEPEISVVLPCFNEREAVGPLGAELHAALRRTGRSFEILFVDDCSTDGTRDGLRELREKYAELRVIEHAQNSGESAAQATGFRHARGAIVITMDSDGQNDPADIPLFLTALAAGGFDCVSGVRATREDDWLRRISSRIANRFRTALTGAGVTDAGCTYRALRRHALREVPVFNGMHRFLPTLLRAQGFSIGEIRVHHRPRVTGQSKYGVGNRLWRGIYDCLGVRWYLARAVPGRRTGGEPAGPAARPQ
ncbi:MAG TPA: glycosyltransferase family 2 protein [Myxococcota bacterium]|nr:glycosyltransferase family 2 protein [Myxococcota bacterium]